MYFRNVNLQLKRLSDKILFFFLLLLISFIPDAQGTFSWHNGSSGETWASILGPNGIVGVNYSALGSLLFQTGQTVRSVYNSNTANLLPDDARGRITVNTTDAITQLDIITYTNGPDAAAEQANPMWYSWWVDGGTFTLSDGRVVTQSAKGATGPDVDPICITGEVTIDTTKTIGDPLRNNTSTDAGLKPTAIECKTTICIPYVVRRVKSK